MKMTQKNSKGAVEATEGVKNAKQLVEVHSNGITISIEKDVFNDLELFEMIDDIQSGNVFKMPKLMRRIFEDQHEAVLEGLRNDDGVVTADAASAFLIEVLQQIAPNS